MLIYFHNYKMQRFQFMTSRKLLISQSTQFPLTHPDFYYLMKNVFEMLNLQACLLQQYLQATPTEGKKTITVSDIRLSTQP